MATKPDWDGYTLLPTDGLAVFSPDGQFMAFVSSRENAWGVWVVSRNSSSPTRLPINIPGWHTDPKLVGWSHERISWAP